MLKILFSALCLSLLFISCGNNTTSHSTVVISILKSKESVQFNAIEHGILDELSSKDLNVSINRYVSDNTEVSIIELANKIKEDNSVVAVTIGRDATLLSMNVIVPQLIVFTGITDESSLKDIKKSRDQNNNITGIYSILDPKPYLTGMSRLSNIKSLAYVYLYSSYASQYISDTIMDYCKTHNIKYFPYPIKNVYDMQNELDFEGKKIDMIYVSDDNPILEYMTDITLKAEEYSIPVISTDIDSAKEGDVLFSLDINYYRMGRKTADLIYDIIKNKKDSSVDMIDMHENNEILINEDVAKKLNIVLSEDIKNNADFIIKDGKVLNVSRY